MVWIQVRFSLMGEGPGRRIHFFSLDPDPAQLRKNPDLDPTPDPTLIRNEEKVYLYLRKVGINFDLINHHFKLEFVDSGLYFVLDKNDFISVVTGRIRIQ